jgi:hypothetical protein
VTSQETKSDRETCDACTKKITITKKGVFRQHNDGDFRDGYGRCPGAGYAPHHVTEVVSKIREQYGDDLPYREFRAKVAMNLRPSTYYEWEVP